MMARLEVDRTTVNFGSVTQGGTSSVSTIIVTNAGDAPSGPVVASLTGSGAFQIQASSTCSGALGPAGTCAINLLFSPTTTGALSASLDVSGMPGGSRSVALSGQGAFAAALSISPMSFNFMGVGLGSSSMPQTFTVTNTGGSPTGALSLPTVTGPDGAMFTISGTTCGAALMPAGMCTVTVVFVPTATGPRAATLELSATPGGRVTSTLSATGQTPASLSAAPSPGVFTDTVSGSSGNSISFVITNSGQTTTAPLAVSITGPDAADFVRGIESCTGATVAGSMTCSVAVQFNPRSTGARNALLTVSGVGVVPATVVLTGRGLAGAELRVSTMMLGFGSVATGSSATATIGVTNTGEAPSSVPMFAATTAPEFTVDSNTCGVSVTPGENCSVTIAFSPAFLGNRTGTFNVLAVAGGMAGATLQGTGVTPGALTITPNTHDFSPVLVGQPSGSPRDFTIVNNGGAAILSPVVTLGGNAASSFSIVSTTCGPPTMLSASGGSCTVRVGFTPQSGGPLSAFVTATSGSSTVQATLSGRGLNPAQLRLAPTSATYPSTVVGSSSDQTFTVTNTGDVAAGSVSVSTSGQDADQWVENNSTCLGTLDPQTSCTFQLTYAPTFAGSHLGNVGASAMPGGIANSGLTGTGLSAAALTLVAASGSSAAYGNVLLGDTRTMSFTVTNTGQQASGPLSLSLSGVNASQWQVGGGASACQLGQPLAGGTSCTTPIRFTASSANGNGVKNATLTASAMPGSSPTLALSAGVQNPAELRTMVTMHDFGNVTVGSSSTQLTWVVTNLGDVATSTLMFSNSNSAVFPLVSNGCTGTLAPMTSCSVVFRFTPSAAGTASTTLSVSATTGGSASLAASGNGQWLVTVTPPATMGTRIETSDARINCPGTCSAAYNNGTSVTFQARTTNGSGFHFSGWSAPGACSVLGVGTNCVQTITANTTATAVFSPINANLVFVSSALYPANLGGVAPYDTACNTLATTAGINNAAGNAFRAWMSTATSGAGARITAAGGFRRMDFSVVAASRTALLSGWVRAPIRLDEYGRRVLTALSAWTGTDSGGAHRAGQDCSGWTSSAVTFLDRGRVEGGPGLFTESTGGHTCSNTGTRIYCFQNTSTTFVAVPPAPPSGYKVAFVAPTWTVSGGLTAADAHCNANKPTGFDTSAYVYRAFLATTAASAASRLPVGASYYAPNSTFIGTSDALRATTDSNREPLLNAGVWQEDSTIYVSGQASAWTGAGCTNCQGTTATTCSNWTSTAGTSLIGRVASSSADFFDGFGSSPCNTPRRVYCFQQ